MINSPSHEMKHLLLVCYFYPPDGGAGTQRPLSIARHAVASGWRVTVITRDGSQERGDWDPADPSLHDHFEHVREVRIPVPEGSNAGQMIAPIDGENDPWLVAVAQKIAEVNQADKIDHVLVTMPPYGMASLAGMVKSSLPDTPVSVDLRDPWAFDGVYAYPNKSAWRQNIQAMRKTVQGVDGLVVNTPEAAKKVMKTFEDVQAERVCVVTNGYEPDLFEGSMPSMPEGYVENDLHLVHVGTLHSRAVMRNRGLVGWLRRLKTYRAERLDMTGRTALPILQAIGRLRKLAHPGIERLKLVLVGLDDAATRQIAEESGCADQILMTGYMPHDQAVAWLRWAQCLFLPLHGLPDSERSLIVPGKTYEYLASQTPILGALPQGDVRQFLEESERAFIAPPCDVDQIAARLSEVIEAHQQGKLPKGQPETWAHRFSRPVLTQQLCDFLERIGKTRKT